MSEADRLFELARAWDWLRPHRVDDRARLGTRLWPDLGPAGRQRACALLDEAVRLLTALPAPPPASPAAGRRQRLLFLANREQARLEFPPTPDELADMVLGALGPRAQSADPALVAERLAKLAELVAPLGGPGALALRADPLGGKGASRRLEALARQVEIRLPRLLRDMPLPPLDALLELAAALEGIRPVDQGTPAQAEAWRELDAEGLWPLAELLRRCEAELETLGAELERRAEALRLRYLGPGAHEGPALPWLRAQFALDPVRPEQWAWLHARHLEDIARHLRSLGLEAVPPTLAAEPGRPADWPPLAGDEGGLALADLSLSDPASLEAFLADSPHGMLAVQAAREGLPGRAWGLARLRAGAAEDPEEALLAAWSTPEDLDAWAGWAAAWLPRAGWLAGDLRLRFFSRWLDWRDAWLARADLELRLGIRPEEEIRRRLQDDCGLPAAQARTVWRGLLRQPGRRALAQARRFELADGLRKWRRLRKGGDADLFQLAARAALLPMGWIRAQLAAQPADGARWRDLPPALVKPAARPDLLGEVEERLAALGRIRREDLDAGREFDSPAAKPAAPDDTAEPVDADGTTAAVILEQEPHAPSA